MDQDNSVKTLRIAFIHPDLGIGGAERLVVDAGLGLQQRGHTVEIHTSYHDPAHCFDETKDGTLKVVNHHPPFFLPRSISGKLHILFAHLRQLHLTYQLISTINKTKKPKRKPGRAIQEETTTTVDSEIDIFFVDQLSTCIPLLRLFTARRVVFYCHFPDKLLASGEFIDVSAASSSAATTHKQNSGLLKSLYRLPMDFLEEYTTGKADCILANSKFTARVFKHHLPSIQLDKDGFRTKTPVEGGGPRIVYPGINLEQYAQVPTTTEEEALKSDRPTFISLNRFEAKKNIPLAVRSFSLFLNKLGPKEQGLKQARLVLGGGYDPRVQDNVDTLTGLLTIITELKLTWRLLSSSSDGLPPQLSSQALQDLHVSPSIAQIILLPNFSTTQRTLLLTSKSTLALLYTPQNEHFGIVPIEAASCGLPVIACNSGGPTESVIDNNGEEKSGSGNDAGEWSVVDLKKEEDKRTGWLRPPKPELWATAMREIATLSPSSRSALSTRAKTRAQTLFSLSSMSASLEQALEQTYSLGPVTALHDFSSFVRKIGRWVGWTFVFSVVIMWFIISAWTLLGTTGSIIFWIAVASFCWYKGAFGSFARFVGEVWRSGSEVGDKKEKKDVLVVEAQKSE